MNVGSAAEPSTKIGRTDLTTAVGDPSAVLRSAIATAVDSFGGLDDLAAEPSFEMKRVLNTMAESVLPVMGELVNSAMAHRNGPLTAALTFLRNATTHLDAGRIDAARAAVITAHAALARPDWYSAKPVR